MEEKLVLEPTPPIGQHPNPSPDKKPQLTWPGLIVVGVAIWFLFFGGLEAVTKTSTTIQKGATGVAQTASAANPTAAILAPTRRLVIPTNRPDSGDGAGLGGGGRVESTPTSVPSETPTATPKDCVLITWRNGSQGCTDGSSIDAAHSQPGYCVIVQGMCANGHPAGVIESIDPEIAAEPTPTYWAAQVDVAVINAGTTWSGWQGPDGTSCVAVQFADGRRQQNCGPQGVKYDSDDLEFIARLIIDGKLGPGGFPKG